MSISYRDDSTFPSIPIGEIALTHPGAIKIGPFGSQLKKEDLSREGYKVYGQENIIANDFSIGARRVDGEKFSLLSSCRLFPGDLVLTMMGTIGKCAIFPADAEVGIMDSHLLRIQVNPEIASSQFVAMTIAAEEIVGQQIEHLSHGSIMSGLSSTIMRRLRVPLPPLREQRRIVQILDTLDTQIQETEGLIAKLKQVKAGLLNELLTRGIDENGEMRNPVMHAEEFKEVTFQEKVQIPREWEIRALDCFLTGIDAGKSPNCPDRPAGADEWGILKVSAIHPESFRAWENKVIVNPAYISPAHEVQDGDLLISRANTYELVGMVCLVRNSRPQLLLCDKTLRLCIDDRHAITEFTFYALQMPYVRSQIEIHATGSSGSMKNISQDTIKKLLVHVPSLEEQKRIVAILGAHDARISAEESHFSKLQQAKKGLMHDLLTGTVRVTSLVTATEE